MLILASKSPRRRELLSIIAKDFAVLSSNEEENVDPSLSPEETVKYLSKIKAEPFRSDGDTVIGADTVVAVNGKILGKPADKDDAFAMLSLLSGKTHSVYTGVTVLGSEGDTTFSVETKVKFFNLTETEIREYIETGEPMDKAGAYGIQGKGSLLVESIDGDYFNVVGLPVSRLAKILHNYKY